MKVGKHVVDVGVALRRRSSRLTMRRRRCARMSCTRASLARNAVAIVAHSRRRAASRSSPSNSCCSAAYSAACGLGRDLRVVRAVEQHRRRLEQVEHEHEDAGRQDQQLQRDLHEGAHQQRLPRFVDRLRRQVALHLALVAAEVRQHQEQAADHARPERVGLVGGRTGNRSPAAVRSRRRGAAPAPKLDVLRGCRRRRIADRRRHAEDDDEHLLDVGPRHRLHAADTRVEDHRARRSRTR